MRAAGRLGAARCTTAPTADGHVSVPFSFFSPPPSAPFHRTALSFSPSLSLSYCGGGWKRTWGRGGEGRRGGGAELELRPRGGPSPRGHFPSPHLPRRPPQGSRSQRYPVGAPPPRPPRGSPAETELGGKNPERCFAPLLAGLRLSLWCRFIALASGRWRLLLSALSKTGKVTLSLSKSLRRMPGGMHVFGREVSFRRWELEFPRVTGGVGGSFEAGGRPAVWSFPKSFPRCSAPRESLAVLRVAASAGMSGWGLRM